MMQLPSCSKCGGFVGLALSACPHCGAPLSRARAVAIGLVGAVAGSAISMTLMACYGMSCADANCLEPPDSGDAGGGDASKDATGDAASDANADAASDATVDASDATTLDAPNDVIIDVIVDVKIADVANGG